MNDQVITLEIEENAIRCNKKILSDNSDYFKVMFEGSFLERTQSIVKLQDVDFKSLCIILTNLQQPHCIIEEEDLLLVLQTCCMLQFERIRRVCIDRLHEILSIRNCLKIWYITESLAIKDLYLKAKNLSLIEFSLIKDYDCLLELDFKQLYRYLSNVLLHTQSELDIFTTCMKWWYENSKHESFDIQYPEKTKLFYDFLKCLDFNSLSVGEIREMMTYPDFSTDVDVMQTLTVIINIKESNILELENSKVNDLLNCKNRIRNVYPTIVLDCFQHAESSSSQTSQSSPIPIPTLSPRRPTSYNMKKVFLFDLSRSDFVKLLNISPEKMNNLEGFGLLGYKELIFLFGGEYSMGRGQWNDNFWVYDTIKEKWERKAVIPTGRRHFETCIANDLTFIIGGTGSFRVLQNNMFWYSYKLDKWSKIIDLPCTSRQIKCCEHNNQLFIINMNLKSGYLFNLEGSNWVSMKICDNQNLLSNFPEKFVVFSYKDFIYVKGSSIIKLKIVGLGLEVVNSQKLESFNFDTVESVLCNNILFTLYKRVSDDTNTFLFERFNVDDYSVTNILCCSEAKTPTISLSNESCAFSKCTRLFSLSHYKAVENDVYLRDISL